jgi:hypothetical protein
MNADMQYTTGNRTAVKNGERSNILPGPGRYPLAVNAIKLCIINML